LPTKNIKKVQYALAEELYYRSKCLFAAIKKASPTSQRSLSMYTTEVGFINF